MPRSNTPQHTRSMRSPRRDRQYSPTNSPRASSPCSSPSHTSSAMRSGNSSPVDQHSWRHFDANNSERLDNGSHFKSPPRIHSPPPTIGKIPSLAAPAPPARQYTPLSLEDGAAPRKFTSSETAPSTVSRNRKAEMLIELNRNSSEGTVLKSVRGDKSVVTPFLSKGKAKRIRGAPTELRMATGFEEVATVSGKAANESNVTRLSQAFIKQYRKSVRLEEEWNWDGTKEELEMEIELEDKKRTACTIPPALTHPQPLSSSVSSRTDTASTYDRLAQLCTFQVFLNEGLLAEGDKALLGNVTAPPSSSVKTLLTDILSKYSHVVGLLAGKKKEAKSSATFVLYESGKAQPLDNDRILESYDFLPGSIHTLIFATSNCTVGHANRSPKDLNPKELFSQLKKTLEIDEKKRSPVHVLVCDPNQDIKTLQSLLKKKMLDVDAVDKDGANAIMYALRSHCYEVASWLMQQKGDVNRVDSQSRGVLHYLFLTPRQQAEEGGLFKEKECNLLVRKLCEKGVSAFQRDFEGNTPAHRAALGGYMSCLHHFCVEKNVPPNLRNFSGETLLHCAVRSGDADTVRLITHMGGMADVISITNETAYQLSVSLQHTQISSLLLRANSEKERQLLLCVYNEDLPSLKTHLSEDTIRNLSLRGHDIVNEIMLLSASLARLSILKEFIEHSRVDPNYASPSTGMTLLHCLASSVWSGSSEIESFFEDLIVKHGHNCNGKNVAGEGPLHLAVLAENVKCVNILLRRGSFTNSVNRKGETELHYAVMAGNVRLAGILLQAGSDPAIRNAHGDTVLSQANKCGLPSLSQMLDNHHRKSMFIRTDSRSGSGESFCHANVMKVKILRGNLWENGEPSDRTEIDANSVLDPEKFSQKLTMGVSIMDAARLQSSVSDSASSRSEASSVLPSPYCVLRHRVGELQRSVRSDIKEKTRTPVWGNTAEFIFKKAGTFHRDLEIELLDAHGLEKAHSHDHHHKIVYPGRSLGIGNIIVESAQKKQTYRVSIVGGSGKAGEVEVCVLFDDIDSHGRNEILEEYEHYDVMKEVKSFKKQSGEKKIGRAMSAVGYKPLYPIVIIPGLASSALEAWYTQEGKWRRSRVWVDPLKIGQTAGMQKMASVFSSKKKKGKVDHHKDDDDDEMENYKANASTETRRKWLNMMMTASDGWSDPPAVKIRPVEGLHGIDYLAESPLAKKASYVFGTVINTLIDVGYDTHNLQAAPYDWRIPPSKLEERDFYYTKLMDMIQTSHKINKQKVVLMGHSMGCRCIQYFLTWAEVESPGWVNEHVHAFLALGPPFLGAPKAIRAVLSGDCMGLEVFLTPEEGLIFARACASSPWLFPIYEQQFPDVVARVYGETANNKNYTGKSVVDILQEYATVPKDYFDKFYHNDPLYLQGEIGDPIERCAVLSPPPVSNLWVIMGVNLPTEVSYYYRVDKKSSRGDPRVVLDHSADKYSNKKNGTINPRGLQINGGMAFETKATYQPTIRTNKSGDGTIPYCSLNYAHHWKQEAAEKGLGLDVRIVEVEGAEHREMLQNDAVLKAIMEFVCGKSK